MKKNEIYEAEISGMTNEGAGVCRIDGMAVFVPMTAVGDKLRVRIVKVLKSYAFGIMEELLSPGAGRCEADCPVFRQCGGCTYRHLEYDTEAAYKEQQVRDAFERIGGLHPVFEPILKGDSRTGYRNKAQYPVAEQNGHLICGFYARHSHRVIPYTRCPLQPERFAEMIEWLLPKLETAGITAYHEESHSGELRHLYLRQGCHSGELSLCFVVRKSIAGKLRPLLAELCTAFPETVSITENLNPEKTNVILGKKLHVLHGKEYITDSMCGIRAEISPLSFYQVNTVQAERLYTAAMNCAALTGQETLLDLYCGTGTIGLSMAHEVRRLIGVEIIPEAVENAKKNAARNHIDNAEFYCGDAGTIAAKLIESEALLDVVILDPPRKGCNMTAIKAVTEMQPKRIVMISCNPATAARDCKAFSEQGYHTKCVQAVDLFAGTAHVECVVLLSKLKP